MKKWISAICITYLALAFLFMQGCDKEERQYVEATGEILEHETLKYIDGPD